jgi:hypothetical protein
LGISEGELSDFYCKLKSIIIGLASPRHTPGDKDNPLDQSARAYVRTIPYCQASLR